MLHREDPQGLIVISQPAHAKLRFVHQAVRNARRTG